MPLLSLNLSIEISTFFTFLLNSLFSLHIFSWNLYFLFTLPLKPLLSLHFSLVIFTFSSLFYWNLCFLFTFLLKSLQSLNFDWNSTFFSLTLWNLYFLSFHFPIELRTFSSLSYWHLNFCPNTVSSNLHVHSPMTRRHHLQLQPTATLSLHSV